MGFVTEFGGRMVGVMLFLSGFAAVVVLLNTINSSTAYTKQNYANDSVYSEASLEVSDENTVTREELTSLLLRSPNKNIVIRDDVSNYVIQITAATHTDTVITVEKHGMVASEKESATFNFGKDRWNLDKLALDEYLQASRYRRKDITFANGEIKSILYYGE